MGESPTHQSARKISGFELALIEIKYGDNAFGGSSGIHKHLKDMKAFLSDSSMVDHMKSEMLRVFNQKIGLGLIPDLNEAINQQFFDIVSEVRFHLNYTHRQ